MAHDFAAENKRVAWVRVWLFGVPIPVVVVLLYALRDWL